MFILAEHRDDDCSRAFKEYESYLAQNRSRFPPRAYELATSDWWFNFADHRCPHDSWLERFELIETGSGDRGEVRKTGLRVTLLGAYHDLELVLTYSGVSSMDLEAVGLADGHGDWRYDEFRVSDTGRLVHEIEWQSHIETARWQIEAEDIEFESKPRASAT